MRIYGIFKILVINETNKATIIIKIRYFNIDRIIFYIIYKILFIKNYK